MNIWIALILMAISFLCGVFCGIIVVQSEAQDE